MRGSRKMNFLSNSASNNLLKYFFAACYLHSLERSSGNACPLPIPVQLPAFPKRVLSLNRRYMISEQQLDANRRNAQLSTGPKTEEGKRRCALNARRHGLTGQVSAMTDEDRAAHDQFCEAMVKDLAPEGATETQFAQRVATDSWRLNRISAVEDNLFALGFEEQGNQIETEHPEIHAALTAARTFEQQARQLQLLSLYEQRLNRSVQKNLALLQELQAQRKADRRREMEEAKKLQQLTEMKGLAYDPKRDGFVFSNHEIRAAIDRDRRLQRAEHINFRHQKRHRDQALAA